MALSYLTQILKYLKMIKPIFSIVVITKDNHHELIETINTLPSSDLFLVELIVVDSSVKITTLKPKVFNFIYEHTKPNGIYKAQNLGISIAKGDYVIVMNSGDGFTPNADKILRSILKLDEYNAFAFSQIFRKQSGESLSTYIPTSDTLWPHQSVILKKSIYDNFGYYPEDCMYTAEQIYFAKIRKHLTVYYSKDVLSYFTDGGVSTAMFSLDIFKENFFLWRQLNKSLIFSFIKSYIFPIVKYLLENKLKLYWLGFRLRRLYDSNVFKN